MKIKAFLCIVATIVLLTGCGSSKSNSEEKKTTSAEVTQSEATADSSKTAAATPVPEKKLSESEKLALDYVEIFLNGSDIEAKKKFVSENILPDVQPIFQMAESTETPENNKLKNASVIESADYTDKDGGKDKIVLIQGEKSSSSSELIIFMKDDKIGWGYSSNDKNKEPFNEMRKFFKEPVNNTSDSGTTEQSPEATLKEISNFVISDIWNVGFVDISWYASSGTSSTGEAIDIDFTIEQLGKAMSTKLEYDNYINNLDTKYDSIKNIWSKLSGEIDRMYKQIQDTPPIANDATTKLDTGIFNQYQDAFSDEVDKLSNS
ncbi:hypothetical protein [Paenibacillus sp. Marseille-Q9583]